MELTKYRKIAGISQKELSEKSGVPAPLLSRLERGHRLRLSYDNVVRLARALNLEPEELIPVAPAPTKAKRIA